MTTEAAGQGTAEDGICPRCKIPPPQADPDTPWLRPIYNRGVRHRSDCPEVPQLTPEARERLRQRLDALADARAAALISSQNYWIR